MLGRFVRVERPMEDGDGIVNVAFVPRKKGESPGQEKIVVYNNKYYRQANFVEIISFYSMFMFFFHFRLFTRTGKHIGGESFPLKLPEVLQMQFYDDSRFVSVHWTGDTDLEDTRLWIFSSVDGGDRSEPVLAYGSVELIDMTVTGLVRTWTVSESNVS